MPNRRKMLSAMVVLLAAGVLACTIDLGTGEAGKPMVEILSPPSGSQVELGEELEVEYRAVDQVAVVRVELEADGRIVAVERSYQSEGQPSMRGMLRWTPTAPGSHTLLVYAYNRDGVMSDAVGVSIIVAQLPPTFTVPAPPTETLAPPTPTETQLSPTDVPTTPTHTPVPPTHAPPTPTRTPEPPTPVPATPTRTPISCPAININVPSQAYPSRVFTLEWDSTPHAVPSGWQWGIRFKGAEATWTHLPVPLDSPPREEGGHWKADYLQGRGVEETLYWQVCLVNTADPSRTFECCGPVPPWPIIHAR